MTSTSSAEQVLDRARVLGAVQPLERPPARDSGCSAAALSIRVSSASTSAVERRRRRAASRRAAASCPARSLRIIFSATSACWSTFAASKLCERQPAGLRVVVVAGGAVRAHQLVLRVGGQRRRRRACDTAMGGAAPRGAALRGRGQPALAARRPRRDGQSSHARPRSRTVHRTQRRLAGSPQPPCNRSTRAARHRWRLSTRRTCGCSSRRASRAARSSRGTADALHRTVGHVGRRLAFAVDGLHVGALRHEVEDHLVVAARGRVVQRRVAVVVARR